MKRTTIYPIDDLLRDHAEVVVIRSNWLLQRFGFPRRINSGYRPLEINNSIWGASKNSKHITCQAVDLADYDGKLDLFCLNNLGLLEEIGLWLESPTNTPMWCHVQIVPPKSGSRVFIA